MNDSIYFVLILLVLFVMRIYQRSESKQILELIMGTQAEITAALTELTSQVAKIGTETEALKQKVTDLETALGNQENVTPELQAAFDALKAQVQTVDDLVPDSPVV